MAELFEIVFSGELQPGFARDDVARNLTALFKAGPAQVERMFSGRPVVLRNRLDRETAQRYEAVLKKYGATPVLRRMPEVEPAGSSSPPAPSGLRLAGARVDEILEGLDWQLAPPGAILDTDAVDRSPPPASAVPEWGVAPVGSDLGQARPTASPPAPSTAHLALVPRTD